MTDDEARAAGLKRLDSNLELYCAHCLKIKDKDGKLRPFIWNRAQHYIHERLEAQLSEHGLVRALLLKGRQQGGSTYVAGRFYQRSTMRSKSAFIMAHEDKATANLFGMVQRYQANNPLAPSTKNSNAKELIFGAIDAGYKLATAGTDDVGRSNTAQLFHGSEVAFWRNAQMHMAAIGNTISDEMGNGSEMILESTANGIGNAFHLMWQDAVAGKGLYQAIFVPWFWQEEYRAPVRADLQLSPDDEEVQRTYGLTLEQMQWRSNKITTYGDGFEWLFRQEYPCCAVEAFQSPTQNPLVSPSRVQLAVNSRIRDDRAPLLIGCDPAGDGENDPDRTCIVMRRGRVVYRVEYHERLSAMQIAGKLAEYNRDLQPAMIFVDKGGLGHGIVDRLVELRIPVIGVLSSRAASDPETYENKRAEMWWRMAAWFADEPCRIPNDMALQADVCAPMPKVSSNGRKLLEKKEDMAKRGIRSPDGGDALALTFAEPVAATLADLGMSSTYAPATAAGY